MPVIPQPMAQGVLGMARTTATLLGQMLLDEFRGHRRRHRNHHCPGLHLAANLLQHFRHLHRLHRQQDHVRVVHRGAIVGPDAHAQLLGQLLGALGVPHRGRHVPRRHQLLIQKRAQQDAAHLPRAQHRQTFVRKRIAHRSNILS